MADNEQNYEKDEQSGNSGAWLILAVIGLVFLPSLIMAGIYYALLRFGKNKKSVIGSIALLLSIISLLLLATTNAFNNFITSINNSISGKNDGHSVDIAQIAPFIVYINIIIGSIIGYIIVSWQIRQMNNNPHLLKLPGSWMYKFKFRRSPLELYRKKKLVEDLKNGMFISEDKAPLGYCEEETVDPVFRYADEAKKHTLIVGASGSGKTRFSMLPLVYNDVVSHTPVVFIDMKRDPELASKISKWAHDNNAEFYHFVNGEPKDYDIPFSKGQCFYDPLKTGSPGSKADMVLGMREYDTASAVYKAKMQELLQVIFSMLKYADKRKAPNINWDNGGIYQLASAISPENLFELTAACDGTKIAKEAKELYEKSRVKNDMIAHSIEELRGQMRTIIASEYGQWVKTSQDARNIDIFEQTQESNTVILFSFNSDAEPDFAKYIGSMVMSDITNTSARRRNQQLSNQVDIYIDEFQTINPSSVAGLLEKSRASGLAMTLAQQSFDQIIASSDKNGEAYLNGILDTCSNFIVHLGSTEDSAQRLAKILGKHTVTQYKSSGKRVNRLFASNRHNKQNQDIQTVEVEEWIFPPSRFMSLMAPDESNNYTSSAVFINKTCSDPKYAGKKGAMAREVIMVPPEDSLESCYVPGVTYGNNEELDYEEDKAEQEELVDMLTEDNSNNAVKVNTHKPISVITTKDIISNNDEEEEDGGFFFESMDDDEPDDLPVFGDIKTDDSSAFEKPSPVINKNDSATRTSSIGNLQKDSNVKESSFAKMAQAQKNTGSVKKPVSNGARKPAKKIAKKAAPTINNETNNTVNNTNDSNNTDDLALPSVEELQLPDINF